MRLGFEPSMRRFAASISIGLKLGRAPLQRIGHQPCVGLGASEASEASIIGLYHVGELGYRQAEDVLG